MWRPSVRLLIAAPRRSAVCAAALTAVLVASAPRGAWAQPPAETGRAATHTTPTPGFPGAMGHPTIAPGGAGHQRGGGAPASAGQPAEPPGRERAVGIDSGAIPGASSATPAATGQPTE